MITSSSTSASTKKSITWQQAFEILQPLADADLVGGAWHPIRYAKCQAFFELAQQVTRGCIVELGTFRGLGAITLSLATDTEVWTIDDYIDRRDHLGFSYAADNHQRFTKNCERAGVLPYFWANDVREAAGAWEGRPIELLVWDLGEQGRLKEDIAAWLPHLSETGRVAVKDLEVGTFGRAELESLGLELERTYAMGAVHVYRRKQVQQGYAFWIVNGEKYIEEAQRSALSVKHCMPLLESTIYTPKEHWHDKWFIESVRLLNKVLDELPDDAKLLWLDSDTYLLEPVDDLFEMLDEWHMCIAHAPGHVTAQTINKIPDAFPEFNIGVIAMRNSDEVRTMWRDIYSDQQEFKNIYGDNDQAPLRDYLWANADFMHYVVIPSEYNFRFQFGGQVRDRVKILHGHAQDAAAYEAIGKSVNAGYREGYQLPPRLWHL